MTFTGELREYQKVAASLIVNRERCLLALDLGTGKEQPISEPVLTPTGWKNIGEIGVGDLVIGSNGCTTRVTGVFPQGVKDVYRVTTKWGTSARAGAEHLWEVMTVNDKKRGTKRVLSTAQMLEQGLRFSSGQRKFSLTMPEPIELAPRNLLVHPYLMGLLLGDGGFRNNIGFTSADDELVEAVRRYIPKECHLKFTGRYDYVVTGTDSNGTNPLNKIIRQLGMWNHYSYEKFIPYDYLLSCIEDRLAVFQGLMDTDGYIDPRSGVLEFCSTSEKLADGMCDIARSLGGTASKRSKNVPEEQRPVWLVSFCLPNGIKPFRLTRKLEKVQDRIKYFPTNIIDSISLIGQEESVCIMVEAPDHLYITNDYLVTHNTIVSIAAIEELREAGKIKCALLIMSSSLTKQWEQKIQEFTDSSVRIVDGSTLPKRRLSIYEEILSAPPDYMIMGLRQAVSDMPFIQKLNPTLVLVDEVTNIKNFGTQQTKAIKKIKSRYRIGLTAEPVENGKAEELFSIMQWIDDSVLGNWREFESNYIIRNSYNIITGYKNMPELNTKLMNACISKRRTDSDVAEFMPTVEEYNCYVEMDDDTKTLYNQISRELLHELYNAPQGSRKDLDTFYNGSQTSNGGDGLGSITSRLLALHLLLDDPSLLEASARAYNDPENPMGSRYASQLLEAGKLPPSGTHGVKLSACVELVEEYMAADPKHKVIVFARFKGVLPLLRGLLSTYNPVLFTGDLNGKQRGEAIFRFTNDPDTRLFLSSDAGGYGVDLWCASHLINYDLPNSSGAFKQRNGRHVRASSTFRKVYIDNLIVSRSIEEYQLTRLNYKARVAKAVLTGVSDPDGKVENTALSLTKFLKKYLENK